MLISDICPSASFSTVCAVLGSWKPVSSSRLRSTPYASLQVLNFTGVLETCILQLSSFYSICQSPGIKLYCVSSSRLRFSPYASLQVLNYTVVLEICILQSSSFYSICQSLGIKLYWGPGNLYSLVVFVLLHMLVSRY